MTKQISRKPYFENSGIRVSKMAFDDGTGKKFTYAFHKTFIGALVLWFRGYTNFETYLIDSMNRLTFKPLWKKEITHVE